MMVPQVETALWQRPEQIRENMPGKWVGGFGSLGASLPLPWLLGPWEWAGAAGSSRAWVSLLKQHNPGPGSSTSFLRRGEPPIVGGRLIWPFLSHLRTVWRKCHQLCQGQGLAGSDLPGLFFFLGLAGQRGGAFHLTGGFISGLVCRS